MNVGDIATRVKRQFGDESGVQISDSDIIRWINDGQRQIVLQNEGLLEKVSLASTVQDQQEYSFPDDFLVLKGVHYRPTSSTSYFALEGMSKVQFDQYVGGLGSGNYYAADEPEIFTVYAGTLYLFPVPSTSNTDSLKLFYNRKPTEVTNDSSTPDLPELYHDTLVKYCLAQAYGVDEDIQASDSMLVQVNSDVNLLRDRDDWQVRETYPTITVLPEDW